MRHTHAGFLLIEVMLVIALIIVIISLAMPQMSFLKKQITTSEIDKFASLCLSLRQCALVTGKDQELRFDVNKGTYSAHGQTHALASGVSFGFLKGMKGPPSKPDRALTQPVTFVDGKIVFFAQGSMSSGAVYFVDAAHTFCYALTSGSAQMPLMKKYEYQQRWIQQ